MAHLAAEGPIGTHTKITWARQSIAVTMSTYFPKTTITTMATPPSPKNTNLHIPLLLPIFRISAPAPRNKLPCPKSVAQPKKKRIREEIYTVEIVPPKEPIIITHHL